MRTLIEGGKRYSEKDPHVKGTLEGDPHIMGDTGGGLMFVRISNRTLI